MSAEPKTKKQKKDHFRQPRRQYLEVGQRGFLATCNFRERDCVRESYNILNIYADVLYGAEQVANASCVVKAANEQDGEDISDALQKEIAASKGTGKNHKEKLRFQMVETGTANCLFIRTTLPNPVELSTAIVKDIAQTGKKMTRSLLRLLPIEAVCLANLAAILKAAGQLFDKHFLRQSSTFAIVCNRRYNNSIQRDDIINELASLVREKNAGNKVDLKQAAKTIVVEIIKGLCCLTVVEGYLQYRKYNLVELAASKEKEGRGNNKDDEMHRNEYSKEPEQLETKDNPEHKSPKNEDVAVETPSNQDVEKAEDNPEKGLEAVPDKSGDTNISSTIPTEP